MMADLLLDTLRCPATGSSLTLFAIEPQGIPGEGPFRIDLGVLQSTADPKLLYPIVNGVPRMLPDAVSNHSEKLLPAAANLPAEIRDLLQRSSKEGRDSLGEDFQHIRESFSSEWKVLGDRDNAWGRAPETRRVEFYERLALEETSLSGVRILDAGCGHGEIELALVHDDVHILAIDISNAVDRVRRRLDNLANGSNARVEVIQANLCALPLADECCDIVFADGVLHHTPSTIEGLESVTAKLRDGGRCFVMVYSYDHKNLLDRARMRANESLRVITVHLPHRVLAGICYALAPLHWLFVNAYNWVTGEAKYRRRTLRETKLSLFDGFSPKYDWHHSTEELTEMFSSLGYEDLKKTFHDHNGIGIVGTLRRR